MFDRMHRKVILVYADPPVLPILRMGGVLKKNFLETLGTTGWSTAPTILCTTQ